MPKIKLPPLVEERPFNVFLEDVSFQGPVFVFFLALEDSLDLIEFKTNDDAIAPIGVLAGLDDPSVELVDAVRVILGSLIMDVEMLQKLEVLVILESFFDMEGER